MPNRTEQDYYEIIEAAFNTALYLLNNSYEADDIAQNVCLKFLQTNKNIDYPKAWANRCARNEVYALAKKNKRELTGLDDKLEYLEAKKEFSEEIVPEFETIDKIEAKKLLSKEDYKHYRLMLKYKLNVAKIAQDLEKTKSYVYGLNYRVKRNLVSAKLLKEGYRGTKAIVGYKLHQNILNFINTLQRKMQENDLKSMHNYFRDLDVTEIPQLDISKMIDYSVVLKDDVYDLRMVYLDSSNKPQFCFVDIILDRRDNIKITKFYPKPALVIKINGKKEDLLKEFKPMQKGILTESKEEAREIVKNFNRKYNKEK